MEWWPLQSECVGSVCLAVSHFDSRAGRDLPQLGTSLYFELDLALRLLLRWNRNLRTPEIAQSVPLLFHLLTNTVWAVSRQSLHYFYQKWDPKVTLKFLDPWIGLVAPVAAVDTCTPKCFAKCSVSSWAIFPAKVEEARGKRFLFFS